MRPPTINGAVAALRFFFSVTLDRPEMARHLTFVREPRRIPVVLSPEEVARLLEAAPGPKYKAALSAAYGAGLRVSDAAPRAPSSPGRLRLPHSRRAAGPGQQLAAGDARRYSPLDRSPVVDPVCPRFVPVQARRLMRTGRVLRHRGGDKKGSPEVL